MTSLSTAVEEARPTMPTRLPMKGEDNSAWHAWWNACDSCRHSHKKWGCIRLGVVTYSNGEERGFGTLPGGCKAFERRAMTAALVKEMADG